MVDQLMPDGSKRELRIEQLSDGYKIAIAMVADIAARMAEANPDKENPLTTRASYSSTKLTCTYTHSGKGQFSRVFIQYFPTYSS